MFLVSTAGFIALHLGTNALGQLDCKLHITCTTLICQTTANTQDTRNKPESVMSTESDAVALPAGGTS